VNNTSYFGDEGEKRLDTNFLFNEEITERESGKRKRYSVNGRTHFDWQHTDDLSTQYNLGGRWSELGGQGVTSLHPSFFITHDLYESLTTQVEIFGDLQDASFGSRYQFGGSISEVYAKRLGRWGRLAIRVSPRVTMTYDRPEADSAVGFDEDYPMTADEDLAPELSQPNVIESTIVVTNDNCLPDRICEPGDDYTVTLPVGGFVKLVLPAPEGDLTEGDLVDVEYTYELGGRGDILGLNVNANADLWILERLGLFGRYQMNDQKVLSGHESDLRINSFERTVVGLQLLWPWFSARAEFEDYDATFEPFLGYSGRISVFSDRTAWWGARCGVSYAVREYSDTGETQSRLEASAGAGKGLFRRGKLDLAVRYRRVRWSGERSAANDVDEFFFNTGFSWWYGRIDVRLEGLVGQVIRTTEEKRVYRVDLRVRRSF
jgi:hypothetical protein